MYRTIIVAVTSLFITQAIAEDQQPVFFSLGLGVINENGLATPSNISIDDAFIPKFELGIGWETLLTPVWEFSATATASYAYSNSFDIEGQDAANNAKIENIGLWLDNKLAYSGFSDTIRPFISLGAGKVYGQYSDNENNVSGWATGTRALVGLEFDVSKDAKLSFALGTNDIDDIN
ncbi:outer membrane beta-barrel protein [Alteromonas sp. 5E99-2]|uniref:outer membrane beta-barrel protein n=1 Tax=Alteromonas sp. 5E99-2 TaxID=2817683 RepID=UPI001A9897C3|nr:outer membrane beta-barrel protein [Alteromonas sp. 5E99-2]MBO1255655.1 outer membrane beta-barrel protein [Alteromonas sp. 5E99-2]